jgi:mannonate dehydratase
MEMSLTHKIKIGKELGDISDVTLRFYKQIGVEEVGMPTRYVTQTGAVPTTRPLVPAAQTQALGSEVPVWDEEEIFRIKERIVSFGLTPVMAFLGMSGEIVMGGSGRDEDLEKVKTCIEIAGRAGLRVLAYSFSALRASEGYGARYGEGRGGADYRDFDYDRIKDLPPLESVGRHGMEEMWDRLTYYLEAVIPVAESAGVRLAAHPNDPPVPEYRGVAQPLGDLEGVKRLIRVVDSPSNCIYLDTGVTTEMGEDAVEAIRYFGERDRIGTVHFRNVRVEVPRYKYVETFQDEGDCNMSACMQAFHEVGYQGMLDPDHTPGITGETPDTRIGWAFAIGQMIAMRNAVEGI